MSSLTGFAAPPGYDRKHQTELTQAIQRELDKTYRKDANVVIPFGKTLNFTGATGKLVTFGLDGSDVFSITIDGLTVIELATDASVTTLEARVTTAEGEIDTAQAAIITNAANIATVDGKLTASYGVTVDVNGKIASLKLLSNGSTSDISFTADTFRVFNGATNEVPFEVAGGVVYIKTAKIRDITSSNITAASINADRLNVSQLSAIAADLGTVTAGQINLTGGSYVVRHGAGFGASSDLVMWYGLASIAIGSATKTNGVFALATDGKVYYGATELSGGAAQLSVDFPALLSDGQTSPTPAAVSASAIVTGGVAPYSYTWTKTSATGTAFTDSGGVNEDFDAALETAGSGTETWVLRVEDDAGTVVSTPFTVALVVL